jgi:hypothetical protein
MYLPTRKDYKEPEGDTGLNTEWVPALFLWVDELLLEK